MGEGANLLIIQVSKLVMSLEEMNNIGPDHLEKKSKKDLCAYIQQLRGKVEELESYQYITKLVQNLERSHLRSLQYNRRESIEIHCLPETIPDERLEDTCLEILNDIGCGVINKWQVHACHRLKNKKNAIIRFSCRKHADLALHNRGKLKSLDKTKHGLDGNIYINESLCRPMAFLTYKVRTAKKNGKVESYNFWKGKLSLKLNNRTYPISHINDLIDLDLAVEEDRLSFFKPLSGGL